jgi:PhoPQ-activated pathogenicity-related protein
MKKKKIYIYRYRLFLVLIQSGAWLTPADSSVPFWSQWIQLCVPDVVNTTAASAFVYIDGDGTPNPSNPPKGVLNGLIVPPCLTTGTITGELTSVPDESIVFPSDILHKRRSEDAIIAFTWAHFLNNTVDGKPLDTEWLLRYPMTRAVVRALDTVQEFSASLGGAYPKVETFLIGGASKRGWTTWTAASVDKRVIGAVPIVAPIGGLVGSINLHWQAYGEWSFALSDNLDEHLFDYVNAPQFKELLDYVGLDLIYNKLTVPKLVICSSGDEFFIPDSPRFFWDFLQGEKHLRILPNAEHSCAGHAEDIMANVATFYNALLNNHPRPTVQWSIDNTTGAITATSSGVPVDKAVLWKATNAFKRDFRLIVCDDVKDPKCLNPVFWYPEEIQPSSPGVYTANVPAPDQGWTGFMIEFTYRIGGLSYLDPFKVTTPVSIVPLQMPYPPCGNTCNKVPPVPNPSSSSTRVPPVPSGKLYNQHIPFDYLKNEIGDAKDDSVRSTRQ